jgi:3-hydroxyisobutyrate dehydrogenase-like beta-hydroxyacid dehydrogenase
MGDISVLGLGPMGSALANILLRSGHQLTVWNRSREKSEKLELDGAEIAPSLFEAVKASPIILVCVNNYTTSDELLFTESLQSVLQNKTIVQLSTGTPQEAVDSKVQFEALETNYLDGSILGGPFIIGTKTGKILIGGNEQAWQKHRAVLQCLVGNMIYNGTNIESASVLDLAWLSQRLGLFTGVFQGMLLCEASGVGLDIFAQTIANDDRVKMIGNTIHSNTFDKPVNTINVWYDALTHIQSQATTKRINTEIIDFIAGKFQLAREAGFGGEDLAALIKVLR